MFPAVDQEDTPDPATMMKRLAALEAAGPRQLSLTSLEQRLQAENARLRGQDLDDCTMPELEQLEDTLRSALSQVQKQLFEKKLKQQLDAERARIQVRFLFCAPPGIHSLTPNTQYFLLSASRRQAGRRR